MIAALAVLWVGAPAVAELITINFTGHVTRVDIDDKVLSFDYYNEAIRVGDIFTGSYTYASDAHNSSPEPGIGQYVFGSPCGIDISLGDFRFRTVADHTNQFQIVIRDDFSNPLHDEYYLQSTYNDDLFTGLPVDTINWLLAYSTTAPLSSTGLPLTEPGLSPWKTNLLSIGCGLGLNSPYALVIKGQIDSVELVPEPATSLLLALGALTLSRRRR